MVFAVLVCYIFSYEPELFPGLIYRMVKPRIVLLIFVSGKVVLTGGYYAFYVCCIFVLPFYILFCVAVTFLLCIFMLNVLKLLKNFCIILIGRR